MNQTLMLLPRDQTRVSSIILFCFQIHQDWHRKFGLLLGKKVVLLTSETATDLKLLAKVCWQLFKQ